VLGRIAVNEPDSEVAEGDLRRPGISGKNRTREGSVHELVPLIARVPHLRFIDRIVPHDASERPQNALAESIDTGGARGDDCCPAGVTRIVRLQVCLLVEPYNEARLR